MPGGSSLASAEINAPVSDRLRVTPWIRPFAAVEHGRNTHGRPRRASPIHLRFGRRQRAAAGTEQTLLAVHQLRRSGRLVAPVDLRQLPGILQLRAGAARAREQCGELVAHVGRGAQELDRDTRAGRDVDDLRLEVAALAAELEGDLDLDHLAQIQAAGAGHE